MMPFLIGLTAALLALGMVIGQTIVAQRGARDRAMNEGDTLLALHEVMLATLDAETGQRGYLLTGRRDYLAPYVDAKRRRDRALVRLREMSRQTAEPDSAANLDRVDRLTNIKFAEMDRSVALAEAGFHDQALAVVQADFGKLQMDAIRKEIGRMSLARSARRHDAFVRAAELELRLLPLIGVLGLAILALVYAGFRAERSRSLAEAEAGQAAVLREANERTELLARELNHRVQNLFSVILSIVTLSGRKRAPSHELVNDIRDRIRALSLAHSASQGGYGPTRVGLGPVVVTTMAPYADAGAARVRVNGPEVDLSVRMVTPLGLIIHELATNAVKYGALSVESGTVDIFWQIEPDGAKALLTLSWVEAGGPPIASEIVGDGFGSQMMTLAARQLGGSIEREWPIAGAVTRLKFPLA
jgi:two-component sensor histidine kinase